MNLKINWRYAIGEIIIVIIGISIAFGLNNWKAQISDQKIRDQYLQNLSLDIRDEIDHLEKNQAHLKANLGKINHLRPVLGQPMQGRDTMVAILFDVAQGISFTPENTTYQTLINSGDMSLIKDLSLRRTLEKHYTLHEEVLRSYTRIDKIHEKYLGDFFIKNIDYGKLREGDVSFLDDPLLVNILNAITGATYFVIQANEKCLMSNQALQEHIQPHL